MGLKSRIFLFFGLFVTVISFQNCGKLVSKGESSQSTNIEGLADTSFFKGDPYDPSLIPFKITTEDAINAARFYNNRNGFRAMAFTEIGEMYVSSSGDNQNVEDQADWDEAVLERCQLQYMNRPCSLFASGDLIAQDRNDFLVNFNSVITVPETFSGQFIPGNINHWQNHAEQTYPDVDPGEFKSYAVGRHGATHSGWSRVSQEDATRRAMEFCEAIIDEPCTLYAVGMNVVFDLNDYQWDEKRIIYGPAAFNADTIPFVDDNVREIIRAEQSQSAFYALALDRYGFWESVQSTQAVTQAEINQMIADCNAKIPPPAPGGRRRDCFLYSVDDQVVYTRESFSLATFGYSL